MTALPPPAGLLLAAGQGRRMGRPKALVELDGIPLVIRALDVLRAGGTAPRFVVLGAAADEVQALLPPDVQAVRAPGWQDGMGASLRAGLAALTEAATGAPAVLVHLVDLPGVTPDVVRRLAVLAAPGVLARAGYRGTPGHPVLFGAEHWQGVRASAVGDQAGRRYLANQPAQLVECADLADPTDVDTPDELLRFSGRPASQAQGQAQQPHPG